MQDITTSQFSIESKVRSELMRNSLIMLKVIGKEEGSRLEKESSIPTSDSIIKEMLRKELLRGKGKLYGPTGTSILVKLLIIELQVLGNFRSRRGISFLKVNGPMAFLS